MFESSWNEFTECLSGLYANEIRLKMGIFKVRIMSLENPMLGCYLQNSYAIPLLAIVEPLKNTDSPGF